MQEIAWKPLIEEVNEWSFAEIRKRKLLRIEAHSDEMNSFMLNFIFANEISAFTPNQTLEVKEPIRRLDFSYIKTACFLTQMSVIGRRRMKTMGYTHCFEEEKVSVKLS